MERQVVKSSNLVAVGYDKASSKLEIEFKNGAVYQYDGVSKEEYAGLMDAASQGDYFNQNIRIHPCIRI